MMDAQLSSVGYFFEPSKYAPGIGYCRLDALISDKPTQRFFDVKSMRIPMFDGRFFNHLNVTRHGLDTLASIAVCIGEIILVSHQGEHLRAFTFGGSLKPSIENGELCCQLSSSAPLFKLQADPGSLSAVIADEIVDLIAEKGKKIAGSDDNIYARLSKVEPYALFLASIVSLQQRAESIPVAHRREGYHKATTNLKRVIQTLHDTDGWDGTSPSLEDLLT